jgi:hypothetical protein
MALPRQSRKRGWDKPNRLSCSINAQSKNPSVSSTIIEWLWHALTTIEDERKRKNEDRTDDHSP